MISLEKFFWKYNIWSRKGVSSDTCKWQNKNLANSLQIEVTAYANMQCTTQYTLPYRVVKTCLWFRKHNFWYRHGSSKFCQNAFSNWLINTLYICFLPKITDWLSSRVKTTVVRNPLTFSASYNAQNI